MVLWSSPLSPSCWWWSSPWSSPWSHSGWWWLASAFSPLSAKSFSQSPSSWRRLARSSSLPTPLSSSFLLSLLSFHCPRPFNSLAIVIAKVITICTHTTFTITLLLKVSIMRKAGDILFAFLFQIFIFQVVFQLYHCCHCLHNFWSSMLWKLSHFKSIECSPVLGLPWSLEHYWSHSC